MVVDLRHSPGYLRPLDKKPPLDKTPEPPQQTAASRLLLSTGTFSSGIPNGFYFPIPNGGLKKHFETIDGVQKLYDLVDAILEAKLIFVDFENDEPLRELMQATTVAFAGWKGDETSRILKIAKLVVDMCKLSLQNPSKPTHGIDLLGKMSVDSSRRRAILFKVLSDAAGLRCRLLVTRPSGLGPFYVASHTSVLVTVDGTEMIVDLAKSPAKLTRPGKVDERIEEGGPSPRFLCTGYFSSKIPNGFVSVDPNLLLLLLSKNSTSMKSFSSSEELLDLIDKILKSELIVVDFKNDEKLYGMRQSVIARCSGMEFDASVLTEEIARIVLKEFSLAELQACGTHRPHGIQLLGQFKNWSTPPRAILFKVLGDAIGLSSRLVMSCPRGQGLFDSYKQLSVAVTVDKIEMLVDLTKSHGELKALSLEEDQIFWDINKVNLRDKTVSSKPESHEASHLFLGTGSFPDRIPHGFYLLVPNNHLKQRFGNVTAMQKLYSLIDEALKADVILVDLEHDKRLIKLIKSVTTRFKGMKSDPVTVVKEIGKLVADACERPTLQNTKKITKPLGSRSIQLLGKIKYGSARARAIMFKVLADAVDLESKLVVGRPSGLGSLYTVFVTVVINQTEMEVDLAGFPGNLLEYKKGDESKGERRGLRGLKNMGNTCYMNSTLQCLAHTPPVVSYFLSDGIKLGELAVEFGKLLREMWLPGQGSVEPKSFKIEMAKLSQQFAGFDQQDSEELLTCLLNGLYKSLKDQCHSEIVDVFKGQYRSTVVCPDCEKEQETFDGFRGLALTVPEENEKEPSQEVSLISCLRNHLAEEKLEVDDSWVCPGCKKSVQPKKKLDLWKLPEILVFHLKRFTVSSKIDTFVDFPINNLDLTEYIKSKDGEAYQYRLYATSNHQGDLSSGHYTAYAKMQEKWYEYNDNQVLALDESAIKTKGPSE